MVRVSTNPDDDHLNPDCQQGKHRACRGDAWCYTYQEHAACRCSCHASLEEEQ